MDEIAIPVSNDFDVVVLTPVAPISIKPRVWTLFAGLAAVVVLATVFQVLVAVVLVVLEAMRGGDVQKYANELAGSIATPTMFMLLAGAGQLAFFIGAIVPAWLSPVPMKERLGLFRPRPSWGIVPMAMLGSWAWVGIGTALASWLALYVEPSPFFDQLFENVTIGEAIPFVLFMAIVPGIVEELLFRGYIQRRLLERWSPGLAITVTSFLFALAHVQLHHIVAVFPIGLWLGVVAWRTGSVIPSMFCHAFVNGTVIAWQLIVKFGGVNEAKDFDMQLLALLFGVIYFLVCVLRFWRMRALGPGNELAAVS